MRTRLPLILAILALSSHPLFADINSTSLPQYDVLRAGVAPTIDGIIDEDEWDLAGNSNTFVDLLSHTRDRHRLNFRMLWDDDNLYILGESEFKDFLPPSDHLADPPMDGTAYTPLLFFDPNVDEEDLDSEEYVAAPDGYKIAWSVYEGATARRPTPDSATQSLRDPLDEDGAIFVEYIMGLELSAHVDSATGNDGLWDQSGGTNNNYRDDRFPGLVMAVNADNEDLNETGKGGAVWELAIAWEVFNATDPDNEEYEGEDNGLFHPGAPVPGEVWAFETGAITTDETNALPSWTEPRFGNEDRTAFEEAPHGRIMFTLEFEPLDCNLDGVVDAKDLECVCAAGTQTDLLNQLQIIAGDLNADGTVNFPDFLVMSSNFGNEVENYTQGDINCDGMVSFPDFLLLSASFGQGFEQGEGEPAGATAAAVPEPGSLLLLTFGLLGLRLRRRAV